MISFQDYINEMKSSTIRKPILKLEFLRKEDETPYKEIITELRLDGSLNINNKNGVRRTFSVTLDNKSKLFFPSLDSSIWIADKVKLYLGVNISGEDYLISNGVFVIDTPSINSDGSVTINGVDKFGQLDGSLGGEVNQLTIINSGTNLETAIRTLMTISQDPNPPIIENSLIAETLPYQMIGEEGDTLGKMLTEIAFAFSCNIYYNVDGYLIFERDVSDGEKGSIWSFDGDLIEEVNYQSGSKQYDYSKVYNTILVIGDNINGSIVRASLSNNDLTSDTSIPNIGFERTLVISDDIIYNNTLALERCKYEMKRVNKVLSTGRYSSIPIYHLDVDKVAKITDSRLDSDSERGLIDSITIPFDNSSMSINLVETFDIDLTPPAPILL